MGKTRQKRRLINDMQRDAKHFFRVSIVILLVVIIVGYATFQSRKIWDGPEIKITEPKNGQTVTDSLITIKGMTKNINAISLNDRPIFIDEEGNIMEKLLLYPGYNIMKIEGRDKFGKGKIVLIEINYDAPTPFVAENASSTATSTIEATSSTTSIPH